MPNIVNPQIVDALNTTNTALTGGAPSMAMGMFFQIESQAFAMGMQNAVTSQKGMHQIGEALVAATCATMLKGAATS